MLSCISNPCGQTQIFPGILVAYVRLFEVMFDDLYRRWKLMNQENKAFSIALRGSVAVIDRLCNICFTGNPKALQLKLFENMGLKEGISCRGWPWINPAHLDLRPLSGYINKSTWRNVYQKPKLLPLSSIRYHYGDTVPEACLQAVSITDFKEASLLDIEELLELFCLFVKQSWIPSMKEALVKHARKNI